MMLIMLADAASSESVSTPTILLDRKILKFISKIYSFSAFLTFNWASI
jgi:hypothetical protein